MRILEINKLGIIFILSAMFAGACQSTAITKKDNEKKDVTPAEVTRDKSDKTKAAENEGETVLSGSFEGKSNHKTSGKILINKTSDGHILILDSDFEFDGAPDPNLAFGKDGYDKSAKISLLKSNQGRQVYKIPDSLEPNKFNEVFLWCVKFDVPLGTAKLK